MRSPVLGGIILITTAAPLLGQSYSIIDVGDVSQDIEISETGAIAGIGVDEAFRYDSAARIPLGTGPGTSSWTRGINDSNVVAGQIYLEGTLQAFKHHEGVLTVLPSVPGALQSSARAINNAGVIVGNTVTGLGGFPYYATIWQGGVVSNLGTLRIWSSGNYSSASDINNLGVIVGHSDGRAFVYEPGAGMSPLPNFPGSSTAIARAINDNGWIVGNSQITNFNAHHAALWIGTNIINLGILGEPNHFISSDALDINSSGQVVGTCWTTNGQRAFLYETESGMRDLNSFVHEPGWVLTQAMAINDSGQIAGVGAFQGSPKAFLLDPVPFLNAKFELDNIVLRAEYLKLGWTYTLESSTDLSSWAEMLTFSAEQPNRTIATTLSVPATYFRLRIHPRPVR